MEQPYGLLTPDLFAISKIEGRFHILSSWHGGYLGTDSWRLSGPIESFDVNGNVVDLRTKSGSEYRCGIKNYGASGFAYQAWEAQVGKLREDGHQVEALANFKSFERAWEAAKEQS